MAIYFRGPNSTAAAINADPIKMLPATKVSGLLRLSNETTTPINPTMIISAFMAPIYRARKKPAKSHRRYFDAADTAFATGVSGMPGEVFAGRATGRLRKSLPDF
jgi:hypothetical protein